MDKAKLQETWFLNDIKTRILKVCFEMMDDKNYSKNDAVNDLMKIAEDLHHAADPKEYYV
ncbi:hypothetical protein BHF71_10670 [Vulcanibacillus modesticaldus]|uniref:Transcriptional regulator n=1 Tax=Vulcanibacillus modesticaldus TaxID=337097 RepID=A0A1D2YT39_9BACI|nr:hypothetical protein [Vulcanibacillus modesticaldus]OEF98851.1 hypothetical protein BHF71_10670 [Vulcanibacillus modesticaldus]